MHSRCIWSEDSLPPNILSRTTECAVMPDETGAEEAWGKTSWRLTAAENDDAAACGTPRKGSRSPPDGASPAASMISDPPVAIQSCNCKRGVSNPIASIDERRWFLNFLPRDSMNKERHRCDVVCHDVVL